MSEYIPPVRDMAFVLDTVVDIESVTGLDAFAHVDPDTIPGLLDEAGRFFGEVFAPTNSVGDTVGSQFNDGSVSTPAEFKPVWNKL
jgi:hypothetical protein